LIGAPPPQETKNRRALSCAQPWRSEQKIFGIGWPTKLSRRGRKGERARERSETDAALAERLVVEALMALGCREIDLAMHPKGHRLKVKIAQQLRAQTPMTPQWIAERLRMGSGSHVSKLISSFNS
jgi:hypothetical protein